MSARAKARAGRLESPLLDKLAKACGCDDPACRGSAVQLEAARIAVEEWLLRYAEPDCTDPIGLADDLLHEIAGVPPGTPMPRERRRGGR